MAVGHFQSLTATINWRAIDDDNIILIAPEARIFTFQGSVSLYNEGKGAYDSKSVKAVMKCIPRKFGQGKMDVAANMGIFGDFEILYYKLSIEGKTYVEIDKFNFKCVIGEKDYLAKVRTDIGRA